MSEPSFKKKLNVNSYFAKDKSSYIIHGVANKDRTDL
jgi:hypothetical protein